MKGYVYISLINEKFEKLLDLSKNKNVKLDHSGPSTGSGTSGSESPKM